MRRSDEYEAFRRAVDAWHWQHVGHVRDARARLVGWLRADPCARLRIHAEFFFRRGAIYCLSGEPKRNDTENRLKALFDSVAHVLELDDKLFWSGSFDKDVLRPGMAGESVAVRLELMQSITLKPVRPRLAENLSAP